MDNNATSTTVGTLILLASLLVAGACFSSEEQNGDPSMTNPAPPAIPLHGKHTYIVKYLGITCGHMTLESALENYQDRPAYHIVMTARNSKFFNKIYKVEARMDSWIDAESLSSMAYVSDSVERGERSRKEYTIDWENRVVHAIEDGESTTHEFDSENQVLDPIAYIYRLRRLAEKPGEDITLTLLTSKGAVDTVAEVSPFQQKKTSNGKRLLVQVMPKTADGEMFARKGEFKLWLDPSDDGLLYKLDFDLSFGNLIAKLRSQDEP